MPLSCVQSYFICMGVELILGIISLNIKSQCGVDGEAHRLEQAASLSLFNCNLDF